MYAHNIRDREEVEGKVQAKQKEAEELGNKVRTHIHACIPLHPDRPRNHP